MNVVTPVEERQLAWTHDHGAQVRGYSWFQEPPKGWMPVPTPQEQAQHWAWTVRALWFAGAAVILAVIGFNLRADNEAGGVLLTLAVLMLIVAVVLFMSRKAGLKGTYQTRAVAFTTDDRILVVDVQNRPRPSSTKADDIKGAIMPLKRTIDELASISMQPMKNNSGGHYKHGWSRDDPAAGFFAYYIVLDFMTGERFYAGEHFTEDQARIVVVQLNQALEKIRFERTAS